MKKSLSIKRFAGIFILALFFLSCGDDEGKNDDKWGPSHLDGVWSTSDDLRITISGNEATFEHLAGDWARLRDEDYVVEEGTTRKLRNIKRTGESTYSCEEYIFYYRGQDEEWKPSDVAWVPATITYTPADGDMPEKIKTEISPTTAKEGYEVSRVNQYERYVPPVQGK
jgi:hypothetical protein